MRIKLIVLAGLTGIFSGCGGGGDSSNGGGNALTALNQQNAVVAAKSFETFEHPMAMSNLIISALHQLGANNGKVSGECNSTLDHIGSYSVTLSDRVLSIDLKDCDITGRETITGSATAKFSQLTKSGQYLEFSGDLETGKLQYDRYGEQYTLSYSAHIAQTIESAHTTKLTMTLNGNESVVVNEVPMFFNNGATTKIIDYNQGTYAVTTKADISAPASFSGKLALRTPEPLKGVIEQYPTSGQYEIRGANSDVISVGPGSTIYWANVSVNVNGVKENTDVDWSSMMSGAVFAFPSRRGTKTGDFTRIANADERWYFPHQSPAIAKTAEQPLRPVQTLYVAPAPEPRDLLDAELFDSYHSITLSDDIYNISADGPWVTVRFLKDLSVDSDYSLSLRDHEGRHYASYTFDTKETFEVSVTKDQIINSNEPVLLEPIKVTNESQPFSIKWSQSWGDKTITVNQINATQAAIDPREMTPGHIYRFKAQITDPFGRESSSDVALMIEDPITGRSYLSLETDSLYTPDPNVSLLYIVESSGDIKSNSADIRSIDDGWDDTYMLVAHELNNGYASSSMGNSFYLNSEGKSWTYNCNDSALQLDELENQWVDEGTDSETRRPLGYQRLALNFTITCDGGTLTGKIRSHSLIR
ncbi:hypothetical protein [Photobacterium sp. OFAV2-7]|uniref:hypothetical protein n=1 Tax=Photobacterium sp. OFAV2-7 TaxID=2917748 RepID=UPI001EF590EC|nr:hypothetical protein [Photobacterium sp. OFAV2-7]MCG7584342.1 hypothetical protein [Photobacterium sp. OFAV2-7]